MLATAHASVKSIPATWDVVFGKPRPGIAQTPRWYALNPGRVLATDSCAYFLIILCCKGFLWWIDFRCGGAGRRFR